MYLLLILIQFHLYHWQERVQESVKLRSYWEGIIEVADGFLRGQGNRNREKLWGTIVHEDQNST